MKLSGEDAGPRKNMKKELDKTAAKWYDRIRSPKRAAEKGRQRTLKIEQHAKKKANLGNEFERSESDAKAK